MPEWIVENKAAFIIVIGLVLFFILRDVFRWYIEKKTREVLKANIANSEKRIDQLMDALHKDRVKFRDELAQVDERFAALKDVFPNPENPTNVK